MFVSDLESLGDGLELLGAELLARLEVRNIIV